MGFNKRKMEDERRQEAEKEAAARLPGLPHHWRRRPADARLAPQGGRHGPYPGTVLPLCRPNAPFAELVCRSKSSVAEEYYAERSGNRRVSE
jgi:hypothetical protein